MLPSRLRPVTLGSLGRLPATCGVCPLGVGVTVHADASWAQAAERRWGFCGMALFESDQVLGYVLVSPAHTVPRQHPVGPAQLSADQALVLTLRMLSRDGACSDWDHPRIRPLVQHLAAGLLHHEGTRSLGVVGSVGEGDCRTPPIHLLGDLGFREQHAHALHPLWQLDLDRTVTWRERVRQIGARARGLVTRPVPAPPEPAGRARQSPS